MSFSVLDQHDAIGWDFDNTLHGHEKSQAMHAYILANPHKRHFIVTFRSHGWQDEVWDDLAKYPNAPGREHFEGVINIPDQIIRENYWEQKRVMGGQIVTEPTIVYRTWKGEKCLEHGLTVLIDDHAAHAKPGCDLHGIVYLNPDDL